VARGEAEDESGPVLAELARAAGAEVATVEAVPDDRYLIEERLHHHAGAGCTFVFTTGGTGLTPDDVTPEATRAVIDREAPGFAEAMRARSLAHTPLGVLTRGVSGIRGRTLIVNFPGSPKAVRELFPVLAPTLRHVAQTLQSRGGSRALH
jgi:molybdopterin adenylyltransferase